MPTIGKILAKCQGLPAFAYLDKNTLRKQCLKLGFYYKRIKNKMQVYQRCDGVA